MNYERLFATVRACCAPFFGEEALSDSRILNTLAHETANRVVERAAKEPVDPNDPCKLEELVRTVLFPALHAVAKRDQRVYDALYQGLWNLYGGQLLGLCGSDRHNLTKEEATECVENGILQALEKLTKCTDNLGGWLYTIVDNLAYDRERDNLRLKAANPTAESSEPVFENRPDLGPSVDDRAEANLQRAMVCEFISHMRKRWRGEYRAGVFEFTYLSGLNDKEIAESLGKSRRSVRRVRQKGFEEFRTFALYKQFMRTRILNDDHMLVFGLKIFDKLSVMKIAKRCVVAVKEVKARLRRATAAFARWQEEMDQR